jgi:hypothetical protein
MEFVGTIRLPPTIICRLFDDGTVADVAEARRWCRPGRVLDCSALAGKLAWIGVQPARTESRAIQQHLLIAARSGFEVSGLPGHLVRADPGNEDCACVTGAAIRA